MTPIPITAPVREGGSNLPHVPTQSWNYKIPDPPTITVLPPKDPNTRHTGEVAINKKFEFTNINEEFGRTDFVAGVDLDAFWSQFEFTWWEYSKRREAQMILPFLWIGPYNAARNQDFLKNEGITLLLGVRHVSSATSRLLDTTNLASQLGIEALLMDISSNPELISNLTPAIKHINSHLSKVYRSAHHKSYGSSGNENTRTLGKVLIYCESGNEGSATVATAYLMAMLNMELIQAINFVMSQRMSATFDPDTKNLLLAFQDILDAKRAIIAPTPRGTTPESLNQDKSALNVEGKGRGKRVFGDSLDTEDVDMMEVADGIPQADDERFLNRPGQQPFLD
ncbi:MAG: hypothetical protein M1834_006005 [Cirrosporium novae-zelandiae]|nr:MAG: hypothetical protein M1834_006005 [Cirrosporium novae-zelandiae]